MAQIGTGIFYLRIFIKPLRNMPKKTPIEDKEQQHEIRVVSRFSGSLKKSFVGELKRGYSEAEILRRMGEFYYEHKGANKS